MLSDRRKRALQLESVAGEMRLRLLTVEELEQCAAIERASFENPWTLQEFADVYGHPKTLGFSALGAGGLVVGYVIFDLVDPMTVSILNLAVTPGWRRRGVATALIEKMISHFPRGRIWRITAETREDNLDAQLFFRACRFWCRGVLKHVWRGYDVDALSFVRIGRRSK